MRYGSARWPLCAHLTKPASHLRTNRQSWPPMRITWYHVMRAHPGGHFWNQLRTVAEMSNLAHPTKRASWTISWSRFELCVAQNAWYARRLLRIFEISCASVCQRSELSVNFGHEKKWGYFSYIVLICGEDKSSGGVERAQKTCVEHNSYASVNQTNVLVCFALKKHLDNALIGRLALNIKMRFQTTTTIRRSGNPIDCTSQTHIGK